MSQIPQSFVRYLQHFETAGGGNKNIISMVNKLQFLSSSGFIRLPTDPCFSTQTALCTRANTLIQASDYNSLIWRDKAMVLKPTFRRMFMSVSSVEVHMQFWVSVKTWPLLTLAETLIAMHHFYNYIHGRNHHSTELSKVVAIIKNTGEKLKALTPAYRVLIPTQAVPRFMALHAQLEAKRSSSNSQLDWLASGVHLYSEIPVFKFGGKNLSFVVIREEYLVGTDKGKKRFDMGLTDSTFAWSGDDNLENFLLGMKTNTAVLPLHKFRTEQSQLLSFQQQGFDASRSERNANNFRAVVVLQRKNHPGKRNIWVFYMSSDSKNVITSWSVSRLTDDFFLGSQGFLQHQFRTNAVDIFDRRLYDYNKASVAKGGLYQIARMAADTTNVRIRQKDLKTHKAAFVAWQSYALFGHLDVDLVLRFVSSKIVKMANVDASLEAALVKSMRCSKDYPLFMARYFKKKSPVQPSKPQSLALASRNQNQTSTSPNILPVPQSSSVSSHVSASFTPASMNDLVSLYNNFFEKKTESLPPKWTRAQLKLNMQLLGERDLSKKIKNTWDKKEMYGQLYQILVNPTKSNPNTAEFFMKKYKMFLELAEDTAPEASGQMLDRLRQHASV